MNVTPAWQAAVNGLPTNQNAVNASAQVNQMLGTHAVSPIYEGVPLVTANGGLQFSWSKLGNSTDLDQPFVMPGGHTSIGRVTLPIQATGAGADVLVSLYPDTAGSPNTNNQLSSTYISAATINSLSAVNGLVSGGPLATARYNTVQGSGGSTTTVWAPPSSGPNGTARSASFTTSGNFFISAGGFDFFNGNVTVSTVTTSQYSGGGVMQLPIPQPSLPQGTGFGGLVTTPTDVVYAGGHTVTTPSGPVTVVSNVWTASWNSSTGTVGSWSAQTSLPQVVSIPGIASSGNTVYIVGGLNSTETVSLNTVYYATIVNGQISAWNTGPNFPTKISSALVSVVNGWLIVAGGDTVGTGTFTNAVYYAKINPDGSLGSWQAGPSLPLNSLSGGIPGLIVVVMDSIMAIIGGATTLSLVQLLSVTSSGVADTWISTTRDFIGALPYGAFSRGDGSWDIIGLNYASQLFEYIKFVPVPLISVPLPATGLTAGATYHVVMQQRQATSSSDYLSFGTENAALPNDAKSSSRHSGTWSTFNTGFSVPMTVYDNTTGGPILHTWEDPSVGNSGSTVGANMASRSTTNVYNYLNLPIGMCESSLFPNNPGDSNPTFTSGVSGWTATNCTFAQSNTQTHGGFPFSGLLTPNGSSATVFVESNKSPVLTDVSSTSAPYWYQAHGWVYSPTGYSNVSLSVKWYDSSNNLLSTSSNAVNVPAATWTYLNNYFVVPVGAAQATLVPTEGGTPAAGNTLFLSNVLLAVSPESAKVFSDVSQITYPSTAAWPPTGVVQLV